MVGDKTCFRPFALDKKIDQPHAQGGLNKDPLSLVLSPGYCALAAFGLACICFTIFLQWAKGATARFSVK